MINNLPPAHTFIRKAFRWLSYYREMIMRWLKTYPVLFVNSKLTIHKLRRSGQRGLFVDCGSNLGQGFEIFRRFYPNKYFDYELFEPNPNCFDRLQEQIKLLADHKVTLHKKAVGVRNETLKFFGLNEDEGGKYSEGGSILKEHNTLFYEASEERAIDVEAISFSAFLTEKLKYYTAIVIKMDIEGGEYPVIDNLLDERLFDRIDSMYVEFHSQYVAGTLGENYRIKEKYFRNEISKSKCSLAIWF